MTHDNDEIPPKTILEGNQDASRSGTGNLPGPKYILTKPTSDVMGELHDSFLAVHDLDESICMAILANLPHGDDSDPATFEQAVRQSQS